ncbi:galactose-specific lectin nattectin-like [Trichomycterus rosablanca]|uniref:galactose-specific lectin nattectin-like n=1 Tax=Trichomycterus rosablanca TaxID=2290929 RepID=UPI002F351375
MVSECQEGWTQFGSRCFRIFEQPATWAAAEQNCVNTGGHLASVHSNEEHSFIQGLVLSTTKSNTQTLLGASDAAQEGVWVWTDGSAFDYSQWGSGEPNNFQMENCLTMNYFPGTQNWNNVPCSFSYASACAKASSPSTVPSNTVAYTTFSPTPQDVLGLQVRLTSTRNVTASNELDQLLKEVKRILILNGVPDKFTLRVRQIHKKSP